MRRVKISDGTTWPVVDNNILNAAIHNDVLTKEEICYLAEIAEAYDQLTRPEAHNNIHAIHKLRNIRSAIKAAKDA